MHKGAAVLEVLSVSGNLLHKEIVTPDNNTEMVKGWGTVIVTVKPHKPDTTAYIHVEWLV